MAGRRARVQQPLEHRLLLTATFCLLARGAVMVYSASSARTLLEGDGNGTTFKLQQLASDPEWAPFLREHADYVVMSQKNNVNKAFHTTQGATMGMWLTGMIGQLGSWCEFFYWNDAGFGALGERLGAKNGALGKFPPIFYSLSFLHGMAQGATVFNVDGQGTSGNTRAAIWNTQGESGTTAIATPARAPSLAHAKG